MVEGVVVEVVHGLEAISTYHVVLSRCCGLLARDPLGAVFNLFGGARVSSRDECLSLAFQVLVEVPGARVVRSEPVEAAPSGSGGGRGCSD